MDACIIKEKGCFLIALQSMIAGRISSFSFSIIIISLHLIYELPVFCKYGKNIAQTRMKGRN